MPSRVPSAPDQTPAARMKRSASIRSPEAQVMPRGLRKVGRLGHLLEIADAEVAGLALETLERRISIDPGVIGGVDRQIDVIGADRREQARKTGAVQQFGFDPETLLVAEIGFHGRRVTAI